MRNRKRAFYKRKTVIAASALCLLSAFGLAGIYRMESAKNKEDKELVNWEEKASDIREAADDSLFMEAKEDEEAELVDKDVADGQESRLNDQNTITPVPEAGVEEDSSQETAVETPESSGTESSETAEASVQNAVNLNFQADTAMIWPVEGNVILDYSMEQSIYFPTLDQYKYNPAIAIQGEVGTPVLSAAAGVIESIMETDETGLTMTVDLGNGYQAVYGQLADVSLSTGSYVEAGSQIATIAEPSIYYQVEGDNLYFQVLQDGQPVDPLDFIK